MNDAETWTQRIAWALIVGMVVGAITWAGWLSIETVGKVDVEVLRDNNRTLHERISKLEERVEGPFLSAISNNTEATIRVEEKVNNLEQQVGETKVIIKDIDKKFDNFITNGR